MAEEHREWSTVISPADAAKQGAWLAHAHPGVNKLNSLTEIIYSASVPLKNVGGEALAIKVDKDHTTSCQNTATKFLANYHLIVPRSSPQAQQHDTVNPDYNHHHFHKKWHSQVFQFPGHSEYRSFCTKCRITCIPHPENIWGCFLQVTDNPQQCNG